MSSSFIGRTLGKYEIIRVLGYGAMATVYKAYDRAIDRYAAIKVLPPHPGREPKFVERFRLEARTIARLQHPHILSLYDYGLEDDIFYLAMSYITGGSLRGLLDIGPLSPLNTEKLLRQIASALDYAHHQGVIHRDIKPGNILLDSEGRALLADFGIAKLKDSNTTLTDTGNIVGTPAYIAPEQVQGKPLDGRADVYSLGVVVYEMLVGQIPYYSSNPMQLIMQHINAPIPSIIQARGDLPPGLEAVMRRVLSKTPEARYQTAMEFCEAFNYAIHLGSDYLAFHGTPSPFLEPTDAQDESQLTPAINERIYTFLFTTIEGSTRLWEQNPQDMSLALAHHNQIVSEAIKGHRGHVFKMVKDGFCAVFESAPDALRAALTIDRAFQEQNQTGLPLRVRIGLHTGSVEERNNDYLGPTLNHVDRVMDAANGGQILLSGATQTEVQMFLPQGIELRDLGLHRLQDIREPEHLYQVIPHGSSVNFAPVRTLSPRPTNLPTSLSSFIGREREKQEIARLLRRQSMRLLTLVGPGGIGKTRLSIQVGSDLRDDYENGVFFVDLSSLSQSSEVVEAIAAVLELEESTDTRLVDALKIYLRERQMLLILDNFEHVLDAAPVINDLLSAAERLRVLVTSREPLRIYGEQMYPLRPLGTPALDQIGNIDQLMQSPAVRLFVERVQAALPDFALNEIVAPQVVAICHHLDGLPLALELAAARMFDLSLDEIVSSLTSRMTLLSQGPRDVSSRQRTMRGAVDWSYLQLPVEEQKVFAKLSVFAGRFTAEDAGQLIPEAQPTLLARKSLLQYVSGKENAPMFVMLETLNEYAHERLVEWGELRDMQHRHAQYYCALMEMAEPHLSGAQQIEWFQRLNEARYNLLAALEWSSHHEPETAGRIAAILWRYWSTHSRLSEGTRWMTRVLEQEDVLSTLLRARLYYGAGRLAFLQHDHARAQALLQTGMTLYQSEKHIEGQANILMNLGEMAFQQNDTDTAETYFLESHVLYRELNDQRGIARCLDMRGRLATRQGNFAVAEPLIQESLAIVRESGSLEAQAMVINNLAEVLRAQQKYPQAADLYRESLKIYRRLEFNIGVAVMLHNLGQVELPQGNYVAAGDMFLEALSLLKEMEDKQIIAECLSGLAGVALRKGEPVQAVYYLSGAKALLDALNTRMDYADQVAYEGHIIETRVYLDDDAWDAAWNEGQAALLEHIIARALHGFSKGSNA